MRRVLFVHYHFLPVHNVAVKRLCGYARHLPAYGWQPAVLSREWTGLEGVDPSWGLSWEPHLEAGLRGHIHTVPHSPRRSLRAPKASDPVLLRKSLSLSHMLTGGYPDDMRSWVAPAVRTAVALHQTEPFDAVITYCPPESNHLVGRHIARRLRVPWVPFFGDLYGFFLAPLPRFAPGAFVRRACHRRWMREASGCIGVSPYMTDYLSRTYGLRAETILTGFDPQEFKSHESPPHPGRFVVSHVGSLYPGNQQPEVFFAGVDVLLQRRPDVASQLDIRFVGSKCDAYLRQLVAGRPCEAVTSILPKVSPDAAVGHVVDSDAVLAFNCTAHRRGHGTMSYPTKVFEALGAGRPILAIPPDGDWVDALLARTRGGVTAATSLDTAAVLDRWLSEWSVGGIAYAPDAEQVAALSTLRQTARLASFLSSLAPTRSSQ